MTLLGDQRPGSYKLGRRDQQDMGDWFHYCYNYSYRRLPTFGFIMMENEEYEFALRTLIYSARSGRYRMP